MARPACSTPRRPSGWRAPGPAPAAPRDCRELWPGDGEDLVHLAGDWRLLQKRRGHRWSLDDLATAWFAAAQCATPPARLLDLGCGIGAVLLLLAWRFPAATALGVEAQTASAALARRSIAWNGAAARCAVALADLRALPARTGGFELVTGTPPYLPPGTGRVPQREQQTGCHFEERGGIESYCAAAAAALTPGGIFVACHSDVARTARAAAAAGLGVARWRSVVPRAGKAPLFALFAMRRGVAAMPDGETPLIVRGADGQWTADFRAVRAAMGMPDRPC
ncbi:MAG: methyltransferase domain-containing protein [Candidatus Binatia bacterium]